MSTLAKAQVDRWNREFPIGTEVVVKRDSGDWTQTKTRSQAEARGRIAVIFLEGIGGYYALECVTPVRLPLPERKEPSWQKR